MIRTPRFLLVALLSLLPSGGQWSRAPSRAALPSLPDCAFAPVSPSVITQGPDGALWFTEDGPLDVGRITMAGTISAIPISYAGADGTIARGPDGNLWVSGADFSGNLLVALVDRLTPGGRETAFRLPPQHNLVDAMTVGPDGALWFTDPGDPLTRISRITPQGRISAYRISLPTSGLTVGPDGALWATETYGSAIVRLTPQGSIRVFPLPDTFSAAAFGTGADGITRGPDGALWFADSSSNSIGRITVAGQVAQFVLPHRTSLPRSITAGPDGALWFTESGSDQANAANVVTRIGRLTTRGRLSEYALPSICSEPTSIVAGPDGALWFTEGLRDRIGRITTTGRIREYKIPKPPNSIL